LTFQKHGIKKTRKSRLFNLDSTPLWQFFKQQYQAKFLTVASANINGLSDKRNVSPTSSGFRGTVTNLIFF
jgi:hypothetical protein